MKKYIYYLVVVSVSVFQIACVTTAQDQALPQTKAQRKPFQKSSYVIKQPEKYLLDESDESEIDQKPRVVEVDKKTGKYEFRWIGYDGKEKIVTYQRHDAIDGVVEASVEKAQDSKFLYKYRFVILPTSPVYFRKFVVQTFAEDISPVRLNDNLFNVGKMTNLISMFKEGVWWSFGFIGTEEERFSGGKSIEFQLVSSSPPGMVNCRAVGGELGTLGVGEHLPPELEREIPIFQDWASGYTIGPVKNLAVLSKSEKAKYILDNLSKFQEAGWMQSDTARKYELILKKEDLAKLFGEATKDLESGFITSEVFHIIEGLKD